MIKDLKYGVALLYRLTRQYGVQGIRLFFSLKLNIVNSIKLPGFITNQNVALLALGMRNLITI